MKRRKGEPLAHWQLTTGEVANFAKVSSRTVAKWCNAGVLRHFRIPQSNDRRIVALDLVNFLQERGMPIDPTLIEEEICWAGMPAPEHLILEMENSKVDNMIDLCREIATKRVVAIVISPSFATRDIRLGLIKQINNGLRVGARPFIVVILTEDDTRDDWDKAGADYVEKFPHDVDRIIGKIVRNIQRTKPDDTNGSQIVPGHPSVVAQDEQRQTGGGSNRIDPGC